VLVASTGSSRVLETTNLLGLVLLEEDQELLHLEGNERGLGCNPSGGLGAGPQALTRLSQHSYQRLGNRSPGLHHKP
jgi:hypothetical protein